MRWIDVSLAVTNSCWNASESQLKRDNFASIGDRIMIDYRKSYSLLQWYQSTAAMKYDIALRDRRLRHSPGREVMISNSNAIWRDSWHVATKKSSNLTKFCPKFVCGLKMVENWALKSSLGNNRVHHLSVSVKIFIVGRECWEYIALRAWTLIFSRSRSNSFVFLLSSVPLFPKRINI